MFGGTPVETYPGKKSEQSANVAEMGRERRGRCGSPPKAEKNLVDHLQKNGGGN